MQYRINPKNGQKLSALAFGCMRFPRDANEVDRLVGHAVDAGVNYFDTAYIYPGNELALGKALTPERRARINLATKLPPYLVKKSADMDKIFYTQLARLNTERIDYYLVHMLPDAGEWARLVSLGILDWIGKKKAGGEIGNIGFSYHGGVPEYCRLLDVHDWDFTMIQYNFLDENRQAGKAGLHYAHDKGLPVMIMEPLRGGRLAQGLPKDALELYRASCEARSPAEWALRWVWDHPEVTTVLSGMNTVAMLDENLRTASEAQINALTEEERALVRKVRDVIMERTPIPCTGCNYCMPCPHGVDIPLCFSCYNDRALLSKGHASLNYLLRADRHSASLCIGCGKCEAHCPQKIPIRECLADVTGRMERFPYRPVRFFMRKFMNRAK